jgi:hypothetical protein
MNTATECIPARRERRSRVIRVYKRRVWRSVEDLFDEVIVRAGDLADDLLDRARNLRRSTAPAPDPDAQRPSAEDWAAWATENLPSEDAEVFADRSSDEAHVERV